MDLRVRVGTRRLAVAEHALEQYRERVVAAFELEQAIEQLRRVILHAELERAAPAWARDYGAADEWVVLTEEIAFPVRDGTLVTCLTRGGIGDRWQDARAEKRARRAERRNAPGARKKHGKVARQERVERDRRRAELRA